jgi:phage gp36-like protein
MNGIRIYGRCFQQCCNTAEYFIDSFRRSLYLKDGAQTVVHLLVHVVSSAVFVGIFDGGDAQDKCKRQKRNLAFEHLEGTVVAFHHHAIHSSSPFL